MINFSFSRVLQFLALLGLLLAARFASAQSSPGNALAFDGANDYVRVGVPSDGDLTTEFWLNTTQTGGGGTGSQWYAGQGIIDATMGGRSGSTNDFGISLVGSKVVFGIGNPDVTIQSTTAVNDGHWHHVAVTRSSGSGAMRLYVDGQLEAAGTGGTGRRSDPYYLAIGGLANQLYQYPNFNLYPSNFFRGRLDEVRFFYRVFSAAEVAATYKTIIPVPQPVPNSYRLIGYFAMEQGSTSSYAQVSTVASGGNTTTAPLTLQVAPNPFHAFLTLSLQTVEALTGATLILTNATGRTVLRQSVSAPAGTSQLALLELAHLAPGLYVLHLAGAGQPAQRG